MPHIKNLYIVFFTLNYNSYSLIFKMNKFFSLHNFLHFININIQIIVKHDTFYSKPNYLKINSLNNFFFNILELYVQNKSEHVFTNTDLMASTFQKTRFTFPMSSNPFFYFTLLRSTSLICIETIIK